MKRKIRKRAVWCKEMGLKRSEIDDRSCTIFKMAIPRGEIHFYLPQSLSCIQVMEREPMGKYMARLLFSVTNCFCTSLEDFVRRLS